MFRVFNYSIVFYSLISIVLNVTLSISRIFYLLFDHMHDMWHVWGRGEVHTGFWWGNLREGDHLEDQGVDGRVILKLIF
jgi:hypothetical protein